MNASRRATAALFVFLGLGSLAGCMVDSRCQSDFDCGGDERCNHETGACFLECASDSDCQHQGVDIGKRCVASRCNFVLDERVPAPPFCLPAVNPASGVEGQQICIDQHKGKVILLFFGLMG